MGHAYYTANMAKLILVINTLYAHWKITDIKVLLKNKCWNGWKAKAPNYMTFQSKVLLFTQDVPKLAVCKEIVRDKDCTVFMFN